MRQAKELKPFAEIRKMEIREIKCNFQNVFKETALLFFYHFMLICIMVVKRKVQLIFSYNLHLLKEEK